MVANSSRPTGQTGDTRKLEREHLLLIVEWLEIPDNFAKLNGSGCRTEVGGRHTSKKTMFSIMLYELWERGFPKFVVNGDNLGKRFQRYQAKYKEALMFKMATGFGLNEAELRAGMTFEEKLDKMCPFFARLHVLYGGRHNVAPPTMSTIGLPGVVEVNMLPDEDDEFLDSNIPEDAELLRQEGPPLHASDEWFVEDSEVRAQDSQPPTPTEREMPSIRRPTPTASTSPPFLPPINQPRGPSAARVPSTPSESPEGNAPPFQSTPTEPTVMNPHTSIGQPTRISDEGVPSDPTPPAERRVRRRKSTPPSQTKLTLVEIYADKMAEQNAFRLKMIEAKTQWKQQEIEERKEARESTAFEQFKRDELLGAQAIERDKLLVEHAAQRDRQLAADAAERDRQLAADAAERDRAQREHEEKKWTVEHANAIVTEFLRSNKTEEQLQRVLSLLPNWASTNVT